MILSVSSLLLLVCATLKKEESQSHGHHKGHHVVAAQDFGTRAVDTTDNDRQVVVFVPCSKTDCDELPYALDSLIAQSILDQNGNSAVQLDIYVYLDEECEAAMNDWISKNSQHLYSTNLHIRNAKEPIDEFKVIGRQWLPAGYTVRISQCAQAKVVLPRLLAKKENVERYVMLDSDSRVLNTLGNLFSGNLLDPEGAVIAVNPDLKKKQGSQGHSKSKSDLVYTGLDGKPFFDTGVAYLHAGHYVSKQVLENILMSFPKVDAHFEDLLNKRSRRKHGHAGFFGHLKSAVVGHDSAKKHHKPSPTADRVRSFRDIINQYYEYIMSTKANPHKDMFVILPCEYNVRKDSFCVGNPSVLHAKGDAKKDAVWQEKKELIDAMASNVKTTRHSYTFSGSLQWVNDVISPWGGKQTYDEEGRDLLAENTQSLYDVGEKLQERDQTNVDNYGGNWYAPWST